MGVSSPLRILPCRKCPCAILLAQTLLPEGTVASAPRAPAAAAAALIVVARPAARRRRGPGGRDQSRARARLALPHWRPCRQDAAPTTSSSSVPSSPRLPRPSQHPSLSHTAAAVRSHIPCPRRPRPSEDDGLRRLRCGPPKPPRGHALPFVYRRHRCPRRELLFNRQCRYTTATAAAAGSRSP
jgi:hypothetical protein